MPADEKRWRTWFRYIADAPAIADDGETFLSGTIECGGVYTRRGRDPQLKALAIRTSLRRIP